MASFAAVVTLVLALTLSLALPGAAQPLSGPEYIPLMPCRVFDSRNSSPLAGGETTNVPIAGLCGVPPTAVAADLNFTIVNPQGIGHLAVFPAGASLPLASLVNYIPGQTVANAADVLLGTGGAVSVQPLTTTNLVIDVYGYFTDVEVLAGQNTALGVEALNSITTGLANTALGWRALLLNTTGLANTATGSQALTNNTTGFNNTAMGTIALIQNSTGINNIAIGFSAGSFVTTGRDNIHIGNTGAAGDTNLIRIGAVGAQTATFIAGINGANIGMGAPLLVNANGQLGTSMSAAGFKESIEDVGEGSRRLLGLRPVRFRYKPQHDDPSRPVQYGLVAEEVAQVFPELVYPGPDGAPSSVRYHLLSVLLLNELQRQEREIDELRAQVRALIGGRAAVRE
jgi:Chaperone of endosialidase